MIRQRERREEREEKRERERKKQELGSNSSLWLVVIKNSHEFVLASSMCQRERNKASLINVAVDSVPN